MVSTRNSKDKFVDGEKVLCYEPDETKAKVLYDSKVLEVKYLRDKRGRKAVYYLVHFHGWKPSWDRLVSEDYILKDTEKNRKLQRELAAKARLNKLGAFLYRSDPSSDGSNQSEKAYDAGNSCSSQDVASAEEENLTATDDDKESSADNDESYDQIVPLHLPPTIRMLLEHDSERINTEDKLTKLPASPTIIQILEMYLRYFCRRLVLQADDDCPRPRNMRKNVVPPRPIDKADELEWVIAQVNLVKEVVQGLRICFDFYCESQLLYAVEQAQFSEIVKCKAETIVEDDIAKNDDYPMVEDRVNPPAAVEPADVERRRSLRSHKEPATDNATTIVNGVNKLTAKNLNASSRTNHCSPLSSSSTSSNCGPSTGLFSLPPHVSPEMGKLLALCYSWRLVPDSYLTEVPRNPSSVYGAVHLARLFVKLPSILYEANLPEVENQPKHLTDHKLKLLMHHLKSFLTFLEYKSELFGDEYYVNKRTKANAR